VELIRERDGELRAGSDIADEAGYNGSADERS
jgi:hypothetical protein